MRRHPIPRVTSGFTLVELLVVIGIIAILIGILLPALSRAREQANTTTCLSNMKTLGETWTIYLTENRNYLPSYVWNDSPPGLSGTDLYNWRWQNGWVGILSGLKTNVSTIVCPDANQEAAYANNQGFGTSRDAWTGRLQNAGNNVPIAIDSGSTPSYTFINNTNTAAPGGYRTGSYGMNRMMTRQTPTASTTTAQGWGISSANIKHPDTVPVFFDSLWCDTDIFSVAASSQASAYTPGPCCPGNITGQNFPSPPSGASPSANDEHIWRVLVARHNYQVDVCFADGHAATVNLNDLMTLNWSSNWVPFRYTGANALPVLGQTK